MNRMLRMMCAMAAGCLLLASCAEIEELSYSEKEQIAFQKWMEINHPELLENYQADGGYYVDVSDLGSIEASPICNTSTWVRFSFSGRNLAGDIVLTRNEIEARQVGTYTRFTRYVPMFKFYASDGNAALIEGTYLAMHNKLMLGEKYATQKGYPREVELRYGTKVTLYMPSSVVGESGVSGSGGYEGQKGYSLKYGYPFVVTMQITDTVRNPLEREGSDVDKFAKSNGSLKPPTPKKSGMPAFADGGVTPPIYDPNNPYKDGFEWRNANDDVPHVYINLIYTPTTKFKYPTTYPSVYTPYDNFSKLEQDICDTLVNRFGLYEGALKLDTVTVKQSGTAKIWYIGRFLDGFIFDSNIPGVRRLIYGETKTTGKALSYSASSGGMIEAFSYSIPRLRYGQWAAILTTSTNAYGASGVSGATNTSTSNGVTPYDYMNFANYSNSYYGSGGYYGGYQGGYYNDYMNGIYGNYTTPVTQTPKMTISTEIPPYAPLLFQLYIEPQEE